MSSYDEHLISMAGGDGDDLTAAQLEDPEGRALVKAITEHKNYQGETMPTIIPERSKFASKVTTAENFWARVDKSGDCWLWTGHQDDKGYGRVGYQRRQSVGTHRVAWALTHGGELPTEWVLHRCDNPPCVNPRHMFLGDATDNNRDRQAKGRTKGWAGRAESDHHAFKATAGMVADMAKLRRGGATQQIIAASFGISRGHVSKLLRGQSVAALKGLSA